MLQIQTLKSIRKWRDRLFVARERVAEQFVLRRPKRILFTPWPPAEEPLRRSFAGTRHHIEFGPAPAGGGDYDLVVPLTVEALAAAALDGALCRRTPLRIPDPRVVELCHDKAALNARLREFGFASHIPAPAHSGEFPYSLKLRRDDGGKNSFCIDGPADEAEHRAKLDSPDYFAQQIVLGKMEFTTHLVHARGDTPRALTISFRMATDRAVRGRDPVALHRRVCTHDTRLFAAMLDAIGFEGLCCVNYKLLDGRPQLLEINPRAGITLLPFFATFLRSFDWRADRTFARD